MKTKLFFYVLLLFTVVGFVSCKDDDDPKSDNVTYTATINGASEVPSNASPAIGMGNFTYNKTTYILSGTVTFSLEGQRYKSYFIDSEMAMYKGDLITKQCKSPY